MSDLLRQFLRAWLDWAENGAADDRPFSREYGLCWNALFYARRPDLPALAGDEVSLELSRLFRADGLCGNYPFGSYAYDQSQIAHEMHLDPNRVAWVRKQLAVATEQQGETHEQGV